MLEAVFVFAAMNAVMEFVLLGMVPPRTRLRILGSALACGYLHVAFLSLNLFVHWGTLIGTMSGVGAFLVSMLTVKVARSYFGYIESDRYYRVGWKKFSTEELK